MGNFLKSGQGSLGQLLGLELYLVALIEPMWMLARISFLSTKQEGFIQEVVRVVEEDDDLEQKVRMAKRSLMK